MTPKFFYLETYGCSANQNNSEIIAGLLVQAGMETVSKPELADICIINTCIVKGPTENKIKERIKKLAKDNIVIVGGCMPQVRQKYLNNLENVYMLGTHHLKDIKSLIKIIFETRDAKISRFVNERNEIKLCLPKLARNKKIGITQILEGCIGNCNFCTVRLAKGRLFSYPEEKIIESIKQDIKNGCKEIWLTSQDNASYGLDKEKARLPELLKKVIKIPGNFRIRLGMMNPNNVLPILDELIRIYKHKKIYKFLHLPVQSGSDKILSLMNRQYSIHDFKKIIHRFRAEIKDLTLSTDIILAYPGESKKDYEKTKNLIEIIKPDILNINKYWPMKNTKAATLPQISPEIAKERATEIMKLHREIALENNKKLLDTKQKCFVYEKGFPNTFLARNPSYKLIVIRDKNNKIDKNSVNLVGKFVNCKIKEAKSHYLISELMQKSFVETFL